MEKLLILSIFMLFVAPNFLFASPSDSTQFNFDNVYKDVKSFANSTSITIDSIVVKTTRFAGKLATELWDILVQQQRVQAYAYLLYLIMGLIVIKFCIQFTIQIYKSLDFNENDHTFEIIAMVLLIGLTITLLYYNATHILPIFTGLFNPEYGALKDLYELSKALK